MERQRYGMEILLYYSSSQEIPRDDPKNYRGL